MPATTSDRDGDEVVAITTTDGVVLRARRFAAAGDRRAVCLCTHAMMANASYLSARGFARHLADAGVEAYTLDWRGHGRSRPPSPRAGDWCFDDYVERDLPAAVAAVTARAGCAASELVYVGHSLGGLVGLAGFATGTAPRPRRMALFATSVWLPGPRGPLVRRALMRIYDLTSRPLGYAPIRRLRFGSDDETRGYVRQLTEWARTGRWESRAGRDYLAALPVLDLPVWAANGDGDRLSSAADAQVLLDRLPSARPLRRVGTRAGDAVDADHFTLFTERRLRPLWDELIAFACARS